MDLCNNLEQITKEYEILCDFKVGIIRNRINKEQVKVNIQLTSGDNFNLYNRIFWCKNKPNFYYFAKYFERPNNPNNRGGCAKYAYNIFKATTE
jgi:hypothetical protein